MANPDRVLPRALMDARGLQANERTLLAWIRTGVSLITFGFAIARLPEWLNPGATAGRFGKTEALGAAFALLGALAEVVAVLRYRVVRRALLANEPVPAGGIEAMALAVAVGAVGLLATLSAFMG